MFILLIIIGSIVNAVSEKEKKNSQQHQQAYVARDRIGLNQQMVDYIQCFKNISDLYQQHQDLDKLTHQFDFLLNSVNSLNSADSVYIVRHSLRTFDLPVDFTQLTHWELFMSRCPGFQHPKI